MSIGTCAQPSADAEPKGIPVARVDACERFMPEVVTVLGSGKPKENGSGTGFIVSPDGLIITATQVVVNPITKQPWSGLEIMAGGDTSLQVRKVAGSLKDSDAEDFALLKVDPGELTE